MKNEESKKKKPFYKGDWHFCNTRHPLLLIGSVGTAQFCFAVFCLFSAHLPLALGLLREDQQHRDERVGGGRGQVEPPGPVCLGCSTLAGGWDPPDGGSLTGLSTPSRPPSAATATWGTRAARSRGGSSGRRMEESQLSPKGRIQTSILQSQDGIQTRGGRFVTLL